MAQTLNIQCNLFTEALLLKDADLSATPPNILFNTIVELGITGRLSRIAYLKLPNHYFEMLFKEEESLSFQFMPCQDIIAKLSHLEDDLAVGLIQSYFKRYLAQELNSKEIKHSLLRKYANQFLLEASERRKTRRMYSVEYMAQGRTLVSASLH